MIQFYNLKSCFVWKRKKMYGKTADLWRIIFVDLGKFIMGQKPSISYRQSTG